MWDILQTHGHNKPATMPTHKMGTHMMIVLVMVMVMVMVMAMVMLDDSEKHGTALATSNTSSDVSKANQTKSTAEAY